MPTSKVKVFSTQHKGQGHRLRREASAIAQQVRARHATICEVSNHGTSGTKLLNTEFGAASARPSWMRTVAVFLCGVLLLVVLLFGGLRSYDLLPKSMTTTPTRTPYAEVRLASPTQPTCFSGNLSAICKPSQVSHRRTRSENFTNVAPRRVPTFAHEEVLTGSSLTGEIMPTSIALCQVPHPIRAQPLETLKALTPTHAPTAPSGHLHPSLHRCIRQPTVATTRAHVHHHSQLLLDLYSCSNETAHHSVVTSALQPDWPIDNTLTACPTQAPI